jgi:hypothetical protein
MPPFPPAFVAAAYNHEHWDSKRAGFGVRVTDAQPSAGAFVPVALPANVNIPACASDAENSNPEARIRRATYRRESDTASSFEFTHNSIDPELDRVRC